MSKTKRTKEEIQKERLKKVIISILSACENIMVFHKTLTNDKESLKIINKTIKRSRKATEIISQVKHIEILQSLYNTLVSGKENYFAVFGTLILAKNNVRRWDTTEKGFQEFVKLEAEAKARSKKEYEEKLKQQEIVRKAKEEGKKVEYSYENGKIKPIIIEDKPN